MKVKLRNKRARNNRLIIMKVKTQNRFKWKDEDYKTEFSGFPLTVRVPLIHLRKQAKSHKGITFLRGEAGYVK